MGVVEIKNVSKQFGQTTALQGIDLTIEEGEFISLIGPSGCGKSTLLRIIGDLIRPTSGNANVNGKPARQARIDHDYGIVFQDAVLYDWRTVAKNIALPLELARWDRRRRTAQFAGYYAAAFIQSPFVSWQNIGTGMLEDGIFTTEKWIKDKSHQAIAKKFLAASFKGWIYCRDHAADCVKIVLQQGPTLLGGHQKWQMNETNALTWPNKLGIGIMDKAAYARTARIAKQFGAIKKAAGNGAYRDDLAKAAVAQLKKQHIDVLGKKWKKAVVKVTEGGK